MARPAGARHGDCTSAGPDPVDETAMEPLYRWGLQLFTMAGYLPIGLLGAVALFWLWHPFTALVHELGHGAVALLNSNGPVTVVVGGAGAWRRKWGRLTVDIGFASGGRNLCIAPGRTWGGMFVGTLAGPAASLGLAVALYLCAVALPPLRFILITGAVTAFLDFSMNLLPSTTEYDGKSDGMHALLMLVHRHRLKAELAAMRRD